MIEKNEMVTGTATAAWFHCTVAGCRNAVSASKHHHRFHRDGSKAIASEGWFKGGRDGCMDSFVTLIARQSELKLLNMRENGFTEEQKQRVRNAVANPDCRLVFTDGLLKQPRTAQVHLC